VTDQEFRPAQRRSTHSAAPQDWARARRGSPHAHFGATARAAASGGSSSEPTVTTRRTVPSGKASHSTCTPAGPGTGGWSRSAPAGSGGAVPAGTSLVVDPPGVVPSAFMTATFAGLVTSDADTSTYREVRAPGPALIAPRVGQLHHSPPSRQPPAASRSVVQQAEGGEPLRLITPRDLVAVGFPAAPGARRCAGGSVPRRGTPGRGTGSG
jgi:hypothetical protein